MGLNKKLPKSSRDALLKTIVDTHCGYIDNKHASFMMPLQRYKDAYLASQALNNLQAGKSVVILTGAGHARKDYGVPFYLKYASKDLKVKTLKLYEPNRTLDSDKVLFDSLVSLQSIPYEDPCEKFKKSLRKSFKKKKSK